METLDLSVLERCLTNLKRAYAYLLAAEGGSVEYEIFQAATVKEFELILEVVVKLLRRALREYLTSTRQIAELTVKEVFRTSVAHGLVSVEAVDRWLTYRDNRNSAAHEYGQNFAQTVTATLPQFITDADTLVATLRRLF